MLISSILKRYHNTHNTPINAIMTGCDDKSFDFFIRQMVINNGHLLSLQDAIYGNIELDMIICNNRISYLEKCIDLSYYFHCPVLVIDHDKKPSFIENNIDFQSKSIYSIAINYDIYNSWNKIQNLVMGFNRYDQDNITQWKNLLYQITKIPFTLKQRPAYEEQTQ